MNFEPTTHLCRAISAGAHLIWNLFYKMIMQTEKRTYLSDKKKKLQDTAALLKFINMNIYVTRPFSGKKNGITTKMFLV